jgi:hypothetical protein
MSKDKAADYFSRHQNDECHITSDGRVFHTIGSAQSFAAGLKDATIDSFKRTDFEKQTSEDSQDGSSDEDTKILALEALKTFDSATATYEDAKALVNSLALETQSKKKEDLFASIEAFKKTINLEVQE